MNKTIGVIAHVDAGKTTLCERLLYHTNTIEDFGRVDSKDTHLDTHRLEKERGITIFSEQALIKYKGDDYYLIDTPGHIDFSAEMERALMVMDYAVIIVSAVEGIQGHTETVWKLLQRNNIPTVFFINKSDRDAANINRVHNEIKDNLTKDTAIIDGDLSKLINENLVETVADLDYELLDMYLEGEFDRETWIRHIRILMRELMFYPCFAGSALKDIGVMKFWDNLHLLSETNYLSDIQVNAKVYKIRHDADGNRVSFIKLKTGSINIKDEIVYKINGDEYREKINDIRVYRGNEYTSIKRAEAGMLVGVTGLSHSQIGMNIGIEEMNTNFDMQAVLKSKLLIANNTDINSVIKALKIISLEDPAIKVEWNQTLQEINISVMGVIQLEVLKEILFERFKLDVEFESPGIIYKETISNSVVGRGHFEPLKHYAEVHLSIEALPRNSGIVFENICSTDDLSKGNQNLVMQHIIEREHRGILTGSGLTDLRITLLTGRGHNKHTSGGDFREATYRALRQGLEKAENILLEPFYEFKIKVHSDYLGKVMSDIQKGNGTFDAPYIDEDKAIITGRVPVASFMNYPNELLSFTEGKGQINLVFIGYDICNNSKKIIKEIGYNKDIDKEYSSSSIFCSKGQGYTVPWDKADDEMHCK